ncbi:MAG: hypothetical protein ACI88H_000243 [Cocleimonas sp.]|jgi:hypothetical protein
MEAPFNFVEISKIQYVTFYIDEGVGGIFKTQTDLRIRKQSPIKE